MAQTEDYMRKRNKAGEIAVMEVGRGRVLTTRAMDMSSTSSFKRRKMASTVDDQLVNHRYDVNSPENSVSPAMSEASDRVTASHCSSNESTEFGKYGFRSVDLKVESHAEGHETEMSTLINCRFSSETTPSSELCADTDELESSTGMKPSEVSLRRKHPAAKMPSSAEIDEFFSVAEKYQRKIFEEKYNYDIVKDVPLEGRYQWVRLKP